MPEAAEVVQHVVEEAADSPEVRRGAEADSVQEEEAVPEVVGSRGAAVVVSAQDEEEVPREGLEEDEVRSGFHLKICLVGFMAFGYLCIKSTAGVDGILQNELASVV